MLAAGDDQDVEKVMFSAYICQLKNMVASGQVSLSSSSPLKARLTKRIEIIAEMKPLGRYLIYVRFNLPLCRDAITVASYNFISPPMKNVLSKGLLKTSRKSPFVT